MAMTKKDLIKLTKEKLIIHAFNECGGMELQDEMLKQDMISEIMGYDPEPEEREIDVDVKIKLEDVEITKADKGPSERVQFGLWFSTYLQDFTDRGGLSKPHHPDMHGCIGAYPVCDNCDLDATSPKEIYGTV